MIGKIDHNFNSAQHAHRPVLLRRQRPILSPGADCQRRTASRDSTRLRRRACSWFRFRTCTSLSSNKVNELRYGWNRFVEGLPGAGSRLQAQLHRSERRHRHSATRACRSCLVGAGSRSSAPTSGDPRARVDTNHQLLDNFSWKVSKHDVKFGFEYRRTTIHQFFDQYSAGKLKFASCRISSRALIGRRSSSISATTRRHTFREQFRILRPGQLPRQPATDAELRLALGLSSA